MDILQKSNFKHRVLILLRGYNIELGLHDEWLYGEYGQLKLF